MQNHCSKRLELHFSSKSHFRRFAIRPPPKLQNSPKPNTIQLFPQKIHNQRPEFHELQLSFLTIGQNLLETTSSTVQRPRSPRNPRGAARKPSSPFRFLRRETLWKAEQGERRRKCVAFPSLLCAWKSAEIKGAIPLWILLAAEDAADTS
ncbi:hypothetical protein ACLOJK_017364 [Asimina triloba]